MNQQLPLSVALISNNEEANIGRTLDSIREIASEIIVVDSGSTDKTTVIAESNGAKVYHKDWKGFVGQKNSALTKCTQSWILFLDCDEVPDSQLITSIKESLSNQNFNGYYVNRKTFYLGKIMNYAWQPDKKIRLVKKDAMPRWIGNEVHEKLMLDGKIGKLDGYLIHYSYRDITHHFNKTIKYAKLSAQSYHSEGKKFNIISLIFNPAFAFVKLYFINFGFLDGIRGLVAGISTFVGTFLKYIFLWDIGKKSKQ